jgi:hypothetical protein
VSTAISVLGGVGLFLLGMTVMTAGLKALAGSALRTVLSKAAATPLRGSFWGVGRIKSVLAIGSEPLHDFVSGYRVPHHSVGIGIWIRCWAHD